MDSKRAGTTLSLNLNIEPQDNNHDTTGSELTEELNRMSSENKKLTEMLSFLCENYSSLQGQLMDLMGKDSKNCQYSNSKKRNAQGENLGCGINGNIEGRSCGGDGGGGSRPREIIKTNVSRVFVQTLPSDTTLVVKDGYQWRKYGQKVTRDNPSPRAYYKCSFAPNCPVKKKVQRSVEDPSLLVAIYEGEHNHIHPCYQAEVPLGFNQLGLNIPNSTTISSSPSPIPSPNSNLESMKPTGPMCRDAERPSPAIDMPAFQQLLVEKMANSLTGNPSFTTALAAAISTRIMEHDISESWENTI